MNKIAVFSDVHGNLQVLEAILDAIYKEGIKDIYCLGDVLSIGPNSKECIELIIEHSIITHDRELSIY